MKPSPERIRTRKRNNRRPNVPDLSSLVREVRSLKQVLASPSPYVVRGDGEAARYTGFRSKWRFSSWAKTRGLKPLLKIKQHTRTMYRLADLRKACDEELAAQFLPD